MQTDNKSPRQGTREIEVNVRPSVIWYIAPLNDALLLQLLMRKLIWSEDLVLGLPTTTPSRALTLPSHVVQVAFVRLELANEIVVMVANC